MNKQYKYETFEDWFDEMEGFHFRSERFYELLKDNAMYEHTLVWLKAAFESGRELK